MSIDSTNRALRPRRRKERGAAAVEFAMVFPLLVLLVFGMIDFGYLFGQFNEVRHAAREGARIAAVSNVAFDQDGDADFDDEDIRLYVCDALDLSGGTATINLTQASPSVGAKATLEIVLNTESLSGALGWAVPDSLSSTATFRLETAPTWSVPGTPGTCS